jgi:hypothetical protein
MGQIAFADLTLPSPAFVDVLQSQVAILNPLVVNDDSAAGFTVTGAQVFLRPGQQTIPQTTLIRGVQRAGVPQGARR